MGKKFWCDEYECALNWKKYGNSLNQLGKWFFSNASEWLILGEVAALLELREIISNSGCTISLTSI